MMWLVLMMTLSSTVAGVRVQDDVFARAESAEKERRHCRAGMMTFANAAMAYRVKNQTFGFPSQLSDLTEFFEQPIECPAGGSYSIAVGVPEKSFTIHCSVLRHDAGRVQPPGFSPRVNTDADHVDLMAMWNKELPMRTRCRARMIWISQTSVDYIAR